MPVKPITRKVLIETVRDHELHRFDREIAARALIHNYPSVVKSLDSLVELVCPMRDPDSSLFDVMADSWAESNPCAEA